MKKEKMSSQQEKEANKLAEQIDFIFEDYYNRLSSLSTAEKVQTIISVTSFTLATLVDRFQLDAKSRNALLKNISSGIGKNKEKIH